MKKFCTFLDALNSGFFLLAVAGVLATMIFTI